MAVHAGPLNNTKPATLSGGLYNLVKALQAAGWVAKGSGDGLSAYSSSSMILTSGATGANGFGNNGAWVRIAYPANVAGASSPRELLIQRGSNGDQYVCMAVSPSAGFVSGSPSATTAPTASDQQLITSALNAGGTVWTNGVAGQTYMNAIADDAAPYCFWLGSFGQGNAADVGGILGECFANLSTGAGGTDLDGYVYTAAATAFSSPAWRGFTAGVWNNNSFATHTNLATSLPGSSTNNQYTQAHDLIPIAYSGEQTNATSYFRGYTQLCLFDVHNATVAVHSLLNYNGGTGNKILCGVLAMPWDGSAVITS